uniref:Serine/threonine-protein phosphatase 6 regulatory subunit 3-like n=1 Tax=Heterorhabditis bacteriophora TaxID=37862 RepID=A0A1I7XIK1_HETBA
MFWEEQEKTAIEESSLQVPLNSNNVNLRDVLDDPYTLQELRNGNTKLIEYLTQECILVELVNTALRPSVDKSLPLKLQYRASHLCSEILTARNNDDLCNALFKCTPALQALNEFLDDSSQMNHLVASFYMKVVQHLLSRSVDQTINLLEKSGFVEKCVNNLKFGAVSELLQNIVKIPSSTTESCRVKCWLVNEKLAERLISLLDRNYPEAIHENVADLYTDLVRNLRDLLYSFEDKEDVLQESLQEHTIVSRIVEMMFERDEKGAVCHSVLKNGSDILQCLLETNCVMFCPSHLLETERMGDTWTSVLPVEGSIKESHEVWRPDDARVVETILAAKADVIVQLIVEDLLECDLVMVIWQGVIPVCTLPRLHLIALRSYHIQLAISLQHARVNSHNKDRIDAILKASPKWTEVEEVVEEWIEWNKPDSENNLPSARSSNDNSIASKILHCYENNPPNVLLPDVFDRSLGELQMTSEIKGFSVPGLPSANMEINLDECEIDESDFEALCNMKSSSLVEHWPAQNSSVPNQEDDWPLFSQSDINSVKSECWTGSGKHEEPFSVQWNNTLLAAVNGSQQSTPKKMNNDMWADFSSLKSSTDFSTVDEKWPGEASKSIDDWPNCNVSTGKDSSVDPVMAGFASGLLHSSLDSHYVSNRSDF